MGLRVWGYRVMGFRVLGCSVLCLQEQLSDAPIAGMVDTE